jgi:hypothetical protein
MFPPKGFIAFIGLKFLKKYDYKFIFLEKIWGMCKEMVGDFI